MGDSKLGRRLVGAMLVGVLVYGAFVAYRGADKIGTKLWTYAWITFAIACGLSFVNYLLRFLKWEYYLKLLDIRGVPKPTSFLTFLSGFVLTVTPGKVGEVFKSLVLFETHGVAIARTAPIVVAERATTSCDCRLDMAQTLSMLTRNALDSGVCELASPTNGARVLER